MPQMVARGELDFGVHFAASVVLPPGRRRADHSSGGRALRVLRAVRRTSRIRTITDLKGKSIAIETLTRAAHLLFVHHGGSCRVRSQQRHRLGDEHGGQPDGAVRGRQDRRLPGLSARAAGVARPQDRPRDPQHRHGSAMVAVLLLHAVWQAGTLSASIRLPQSGSCAPCSRLPTSARPSPKGAAQRLVEGGFTPSAMTTRSRRSKRFRTRWRDYDPEDTMRFYALRLHEVGMIKSNPSRSSPTAPTGAS